jgi:hypothetical protein
VLIISPDRREGSSGLSEVAVWTDSPIVEYADLLFGELWRNSTTIQDRILEIETERARVLMRENQ